MTGSQKYMAHKQKATQKRRQIRSDIEKVMEGEKPFSTVDHQAPPEKPTNFNPFTTFEIFHKKKAR